MQQSVLNTQRHPNENHIGSQPQQRTGITDTMNQLQASNGLIAETFPRSGSSQTHPNTQSSIVSIQSQQNMVNGLPIMTTSYHTSSSPNPFPAQKTFNQSMHLQQPSQRVTSQSHMTNNPQLAQQQQYLLRQQPQQSNAQPLHPASAAMLNTRQDTTLIQAHIIQQQQRLIDQQQHQLELLQKQMQISGSYDPPHPPKNTFSDNSTANQSNAAVQQYPLQSRANVATTVPTTTAVVHRGNPPVPSASQASSLPPALPPLRPQKAIPIENIDRIYRNSCLRLKALCDLMQQPATFRPAVIEFSSWCDDDRAYVPQLAASVNETFYCLVCCAIKHPINIGVAMSVIEVALRHSLKMIPKARESLEAMGVLISYANKAYKTNTMARIDILMAQSIHKTFEEIHSDLADIATTATTLPNQPSSLSQAVVATEPRPPNLYARAVYAALSANTNINTLPLTTTSVPSTAPTLVPVRTTATSIQPIADQAQILQLPSATTPSLNNQGAGPNFAIPNQSPIISNPPNYSYPEKKFLRMITQLVAPFEALDDSLRVDIVVTLTQELVNRIRQNTTSLVSPTYINLEAYKTSDPSKRQEWPGKLQTLTLNSQILPLHRKTYQRRDGVICAIGKDFPCNIAPHLIVGENGAQLWMKLAKNSPQYSFEVNAVEMLNMEDALRCILNSTPFKVANSLALVSRLFFRDPDLELLETAVPLSLSCPLVMSRLKVPVRGTNCTHVRCFDLENWLASYSSVKTGQPTPMACPICSFRLTVDQVHVDPFIRHVLDSVSVELATVYIREDGSWGITPDATDFIYHPEMPLHTDISAIDGVHVKAFESIITHSSALDPSPLGSGLNLPTTEASPSISNQTSSGLPLKKMALELPSDTASVVSSSIGNDTNVLLEPPKIPAPIQTTSSHGSGSIIAPIASSTSDLSREGSILSIPSSQIPTSGIPNPLNLGSSSAPDISQYISHTPHSRLSVSDSRVSGTPILPSHKTFDTNQNPPQLYQQTANIPRTDTPAQASTDASLPPSTAAHFLPSTAIDLPPQIAASATSSVISQPTSIAARVVGDPHNVQSATSISSASNGLVTSSSEVRSDMPSVTSLESTLFYADYLRALSQTIRESSTSRPSSSPVVPSESVRSNAAAPIALPTSTSAIQPPKPATDRVSSLPPLLPYNNAEFKKSFPTTFTSFTQHTAHLNGNSRLEQSSGRLKGWRPIMPVPRTVYAGAAPPSQSAKDSKSQMSHAQLHKSTKPLSASSLQTKDSIRPSPHSIIASQEIHRRANAILSEIPSLPLPLGGKVAETQRQNIHKRISSETSSSTSQTPISKLLSKHHLQTNNSSKHTSVEVSSPRIPEIVRPSSHNQPLLSKGKIAPPAPYVLLTVYPKRRQQNIVSTKDSNEALVRSARARKRLRIVDSDSDIIDISTDSTDSTDSTNTTDRSDTTDDTDLIDITGGSDSSDSDQVDPDIVAQISNAFVE
ncbi:hypothetical protein BASA62_006738 [Batrachochytrium salamandrivorans]|nr:hypothetical protein BASA62_006738 [Batrachochytrium salamandrivorans]